MTEVVQGVLAGAVTGAAAGAVQGAVTAVGNQLGAGESSTQQTGGQGQQGGQTENDSPRTGESSST